MAFEPQSDYVFDEAGDDEYRNMQRNIASLNVFNASNGPQQSFAALGTDSSDATEPLQHSDFASNVFFNPDSGAISSVPSWSKMPRDLRGPTTQADILDGRQSSVSQHYGQITPPDDTPPKDVAEKSQQPRTASRAEPILSAKSERARNAANQRHAKAKKARKDSARSSKTESVEDDEAEEGDGKREKYREKNRLAAAKCRAKKKTHTEDLEESARHITATNSRLRAEERELRDLFSSLRHQALAHDPTQGCQCSSIHMYNNHKAQEAARSAAMGLVGAIAPSQGIASPSIGSDASGVNSPRFASQSGSRAQSFSNSGPRYTSQQSRTQSGSGQFAYASAGPNMRRQSQMGQQAGSPSESADLFDWRHEHGGDSMELS
ncbi:Putative basic-leucine zipper domain-containing protein [Septoria linicola]|uniref:Basic-leucine zipper domain-containing protein n=1 Tax=Septoria linicola TaxID=215465 RepID=A0A9Q9AIZ0_9PEZI|nr:putative basic-leucine zipper domain-containing protein [Septoria linicola]USW49910.1 Putative basic-leucine zipper domain-containing protein [Septoria linicola]